MGADSGYFVPFLFLINNELEREWAEHAAFDVRKLPPRTNGRLVLF